ncbi:MAG: tetratricopeptide repeat protein [Myxococcales bacterium]|nr:tetratricopeptide repeat protein [Myxococcales bacterium]
MSEHIRTWGPVVVVVALLPAAFVGLRACLPPIGESADVLREPPGATSRSGVCQGCHLDATEAWRRSTHAVAEATIVASSDPALADGGPWADQREGERTQLTVVRSIGDTPLRQYLVPLDDGRMQVTQAAWDPMREEWFDVFDDDRQPGEWGHWTGGGMTWNSQCASCHNTGVRKGYDAATDTYATTMTEHGVGCEACHGDGSDHASGGPPPEVASERWLDVCASCHALRAELTGAFAPGEAFLDHFAPMVVDLTDRTWPDGQIRAEAFEYTAFVGSRMAQLGMTCLDCHDPHSGSLLRSGDALCTDCHAALPDFASHDRHETGVGCVGCHMPTTVYMQRDPRHDHGFPVPSPSGEPGAPDGCTHCHDDRDGGWARQQIRDWYGPSDAARRARAEAVVAARSANAAARTVLQPLLADAEAPVGWRAAAASTLQPFLAEPEVREALVVALQDEAALVRFAAAGALVAAGGDPEVAAALDQALADPVRAVRVQAARGRPVHDPSDPRMADYAAYLALNADQPTALQEAASWQLLQGRPAAAVRSLRRAVAMDERSAMLRDTLAVALSVAGDAAGATQQLQRATELAPDDAALWMRLALAQAGSGEPAAAATSLQTAAQLDPTFARAWYNLGLLQVQQGDAEAGVRSLQRATEEAPGDAELAYGLAATLWEQGDAQRAVRQARIVLELQPGHLGAARILELGR